MITLQNEVLTVTINKKGAELSSIKDKKTGYEYLWQADPDYWARHAPVLFPNVGSLKDNRFFYEGKEYHLPRHGFARDLLFTVQNTTSNSASFYLKSSQETKKHYPFDFSFQITYILHGNTVTTTYEILNPSDDTPLFYTVGGHPAFNVAQIEKDGENEFDQVSYSLSPSGHYLKIPLNKEGLTKVSSAKYQPISHEPLNHKDFKEDALIYQISPQTEITLRDLVNDVTIKLKPSRMDYVGIWSCYPKRAGFVCLEPWSGIADRDDATGEIEEKYSVTRLEPNQIMTHDYTLTFTKG